MPWESRLISWEFRKIVKKIKHKIYSLNFNYLLIIKVLRTHGFMHGAMDGSLSSSICWLWRILFSVTTNDSTGFISSKSLEIFKSEATNWTTSPNLTNGDAFARSISRSKLLNILRVFWVSKDPVLRFAKKFWISSWKQWNQLKGSGVVGVLSSEYLFKAVLFEPIPYSNSWTVFNEGNRKVFHYCRFEIEIW